MEEHFNSVSSFLHPALNQLRRQRGDRFVQRLLLAIHEGQNTHRIAEHFAVSKGLVNALRIRVDVPENPLPPMRIVAMNESTVHVLDEAPRSTGLRIVAQRVAVVLLMMLVFAGQSLSQLTLKQWEQYEKDRKDVGSALLWSLIIPGGGQFYAEQPSTGLLFFGGTMLAAIPLFKKPSSTDETRGAAVRVLVIRTIELLLLPAAVHNYNRKLRWQVTAFAEPKLSSVSVGLTVSF